MQEGGKQAKQTLGRQQEPLDAVSSLACEYQPVDLYNYARVVILLKRLLAYNRRQIDELAEENCKQKTRRLLQFTGSEKILPITGSLHRPSI